MDTAILLQSATVLGENKYKYQGGHSDMSVFTSSYTSSKMSGDPRVRTTCRPSHNSQTSLEVDLFPDAKVNTQYHTTLRLLNKYLSNAPQQLQFDLHNRFLRAPNQSPQRERPPDANRARNCSQDAQGRTGKYDILQETKTLTEILLRDLIPKQRDQGCCEELIRFLFIKDRDTYQYR
jgi:hypothetical protein